MQRQRVTSREYKIMLAAERFSGSARKLSRVAHTYWRELARAAGKSVARVDGDLQTIKSHRLIRFLDTPDRQLRAAGYILRDRRDVDGATREVTLKFRHPDRHVTADREMEPARRKHARSKFEEDIKTPFRPMFSYSTTLPLGENQVPGQLEDLVRLFPDVGRRLGEFKPEDRLDAVRGFTAREIVLGGASLRLARRPKTDAESALIVWYDHAGAADTPCAVEFSFRYGHDREKYDGAAARAAFDVFAVLGTQQPWLQTGPGTKTDFVFE